MSKATVDWEAIEPHWRAGVPTKQELAKQFGVSRAAMDKHFAKLGIDRDLTAKIQAKAERVRLQRKDAAPSPGFVYVIYVDTAGECFYKIGKSKGFSDRMSSHQTSSPFDVCVAICYFVGNMSLEERILHSMFDGKCVRGEWYRLSSDDLQVIARRSLLVSGNG